MARLLPVRSSSATAPRSGPSTSSFSFKPLIHTKSDLVQKRSLTFAELQGGSEHARRSSRREEEARFRPSRRAGPACQRGQLAAGGERGERGFVLGDVPPGFLLCVRGRLVKASETVFKCSIEDTKRTPPTKKPVKGFVPV